MARKTLTFLSFFAIVLMISSVAWADTVTLNFTTSNASSSNPWTTPPPGGSYGTITLTLVGGNIQVSVQMIAGYYLIQDSLGWNWGGSGAAPTISVTGLPSGYALASGGVPGNSAMDGFGKYVYGIDGPNWGSGLALNSLSFTIVGNYNSVYEFVGLNSDGFTISAHIYDSNSTAVNKTGYVTTPEPGSLTLLLLGAGALLLGGRWKR